MSTTGMNEPRIRVVMGGDRVFYCSLTAAQVLKNEHFRNQVKWPGPSALKNSPRGMTDLAAKVMTNEINRQNRGLRLVAPGERFGRLLALSVALDAGIQLRWNCVCDCGVEKRVQHKHLTEGGTRSCGCLRQTSALERWAKVRAKKAKARKAAA